VGSKRTRQRQLQKLAARRAAERKRQRRRRIVAGVVAFVVAAGGGTAAFFAFTGKKAPAKTSASPSAQPLVACGGTRPAAAGKKKRSFDQAPPPTIDRSRSYTATMVTSCGTIQLQLFPKVAPVAVNSFVFLARHGYFDGLFFHRVVKNFVIQGGDPLGMGSGGPGYSFKDELGGGLTYKVGTLAMANSGRNTNGSQFFIVSGPDGPRQLEHKYTIFGKVRAGLPVVRTIQDVPTNPSTQRPIRVIYIERVTISER